MEVPQIIETTTSSTERILGFSDEELNLLQNLQKLCKLTLKSIRFQSKALELIFVLFSNILNRINMSKSQIK